MAVYFLKNGQMISNECVFLLTGKPRMGKSTAIKKILNRLGPDICGGFYTEEIRDANDRIGFRCVSVDGESQEIANIGSNSPISVGRYGVDIKNFEHFTIPILESSLISKKVIIMDEIGFMQLLSYPFQELVSNIITQRNHVVLGTIPVDSHPVVDTIKKQQGVKVFHLNENNRDLIPGDITNIIYRTIE